MNWKTWGRTLCFGMVLGMLSGCGGDEWKAPGKVFAYAAAQYSNLIYSFEVNRLTGALTETSVPSIAAQDLPMITTLSHDHSYLLAANYNSSSISSYAIDRKTGNLTLVEHHALSSGDSGPAWLFTHPTKNRVYSANAGSSTISVLTVHEDGTLEALSSVSAGSGVASLAINAQGTLLYSADQGANRIGIFSIASDGSLTALTPVALASGAQPNHLLLSPDGRFLYTANWGTENVSQFQVAGSSLVSIGSDVATGSGGVYTLAISPDQKFLYAMKPYAGVISMHAIDAHTGALGASTPISQPGAVSIAFWNPFAFLVSWTGNASGLPVQTRLSSGSGLSSDGSNSPARQGLYWMTTVEF